MVGFQKGNYWVKQLTLFFFKILDTSCQFAFRICCILKYTSNS